MNKKISLRSLMFCFAIGCATVIQASAHEKWFHETENYGLRWDLFFRPLPLALFGAVLLATLAAGLLWRKRGRGFVPGPENFGTTDDRRSALYGLIPAILGIHVAVPLLVSGVQGELFTPNNKLPGVWMYALGLAQTGIALAIFYGALTRIASVALAVLWFAGIFLVAFPTRSPKESAKKNWRRMCANDTQSTSKLFSKRATNKPIITKPRSVIRLKLFRRQIRIL